MATSDTNNTDLTRAEIRRTRPGGPLRKAEVSVARNYLTAEEITELNRVVTIPRRRRGPGRRRGQAAGSGRHAERGAWGRQAGGKEGEPKGDGE